jgi:hypothetical protein
MVASSRQWSLGSRMSQNGIHQSQVLAYDLCDLEKVV